MVGERSVATPGSIVATFHGTFEDLTTFAKEAVTMMVAARFLLTSLERDIVFARGFLLVKIQIPAALPAGLRT
ncbi:hypothetical protein CLOM_g14429 [Closterium sp. NIES-68]|nr:hypothetical protein CLOM_g14429 [Closterium sp. NIES-68]GJP78399.1 hypothetical protein CLOP_g8701 [Closterium sp. NIES-67]